jgi:Flagellar hook-basal body complex protein FliE
MIPAISGALGQLNPSEWGVGSIGGAGAAQGNPAGQAGATQASQGLATGQLSDPTQAITAVENASLSMDLASQIRDKLVSAETSIFQTQV